jgi:hypothetical protein
LNGQSTSVSFRREQNNNAALAHRQSNSDSQSKMEGIFGSHQQQQTMAMSPSVKALHRFFFILMSMCHSLNSIVVKI